MSKNQIDQDLDRDINDMFGDTLNDKTLAHNQSQEVLFAPNRNDSALGIQKSSSEKQLNAAGNRGYRGSVRTGGASPSEGGQQDLSESVKTRRVDTEGMLTEGEQIRLKKKLNKRSNPFQQKMVEAYHTVASLDKETLKEKYEEANKFYDKAQTLLAKSPGILKAQEPERITKPYWGWFKQILSLAIAILVIYYVITTNLSQIGAEKSQEVSILKQTELVYDVSEGIYTLLPLHFFTTLNKQEVLNRMECLVNGNTNQCNLYEERKCEIYGIKSSRYDVCMLTQYEKAGFNLRSFCDKHYNASSTEIWTLSESQSPEYLNQKYACLQNAGVTKGRSFCDEKLQISGSQNQEERYNCYIQNGVLNSTFADERCDYYFPKDSPSSDTRDQYAICMTESGIKPQSNKKFECDNAFPWQRDDYFVGECKSILGDSLATLVTLPPVPNYEIVPVEIDSNLVNGFDNFTQDLEAFFDPDDLLGNETIPIGDATELEDLIISTEDLSSLDLTGGFGGFRRLQLDFSTPATTIVPETTTVIPETTSLDSFTDFEEESVLDAAALTDIALEDTALDLAALNTTSLNTTALDTTALDLAALNTTALDTTALDLTSLNTTSLNTTALDTTALDLTSLNTTSLNLTDLTEGLDDLEDLDLEGLTDDLLDLGQALGDFTSDFNPLEAGESVFTLYGISYPGYKQSEKQIQDQIRINEWYTAQAQAKIEAEQAAIAAAEAAAAEAAAAAAAAAEEEASNPFGSDPFADFIDSVVDFFNGTESEEDGGEGEEVISEPPPIVLDLSSDVDYGYVEPEQSQWSAAAYGTPTESSCQAYFQAGLDLSDCYDTFVRKYETSTCDVLVYNTWVNKQLAIGQTDFLPPPGEYFNCYFSLTQMKNDAASINEHKDACDNIYDDQKERLNCYDYIRVPYGIEDQVKICTNKYKKQSQIDRLYKCLEDFNISKSMDFCNMHPDKNILDFTNPNILHLNYLSLSKEPYFECVGQVDETKAENYDSRYCTADLSLYKKFEELASQENLLLQSQLVRAEIFTSDFDPDANVGNATGVTGFPQVDYDQMASCLFHYKMPPSAVQEWICRNRHIPDIGPYETTLLPCTDRFDDICFEYYFEVFTSEQCISIYENIYKMQVGGDQLFEKDFRVQCKKVEINLAPYNACVKKIDTNGTLSQMNIWKEEYLTKQGKNDSFRPYANITNDTLADYCSTMFDKDPYDFIECMNFINQPLGADECLFLPEYKYKENVHLFNYYQKYICLLLKETVLDDQAKQCVFDGIGYYQPGEDMNFVTINECLKNYEETPGTKMKMKKVGSITIYEQIIIEQNTFDEAVQEEEEEYEIPSTITFDRPTTLTEEQIQKFLCEDSMSLNFTTTPFQKIIDYKRQNFNTLTFRMGCEVFTQFNGTHNNTVVHFSFPSENIQFTDNLSTYDDGFNSSLLFIKRTDSNKQYFNMTMGEDLNFLKVENHYVYYYDSVDQVSIKNGDKFEEFKAHGNTTTILETEPLTVFDQSAKQVSVFAEPLKVIEIGKIVTFRILGIPVLFKDVETKKMDFKKVDQVVEVLRREEMSSRLLRQIQNSLIVNLKLDFSEQTIEYQFFTFGDIIGKLGGLWATYQSILGNFAVLALVMYVYNFAQMTKRKDQQEIRLIEMGQYSKHLVSIEESIQEQFETETGAAAQVLKEDLFKINEALTLDPKMYHTSIYKHALMREILAKYYPQGLKDLFSQEMAVNEWERLETFELEKKHQYLKNKTSFSLGEMIDDIQERMSIYGIYKLKDRHELEDIRIQQHNQQLKNANDRIKKLEEKMN